VWGENKLFPTRSKGTWKITILTFFLVLIIGPNEWTIRKTFFNEQYHQERQVTILLKTTAKKVPFTKKL
jgi:hypothetical protein